MSMLGLPRYGDVVFKELPPKMPESDFWERAGHSLNEWSPWPCQSTVKHLTNGEIEIDSQEFERCQLIFRKTVAYTLLAPLTLTIWLFFRLSSTYALHYEWLQNELRRDPLPASSAPLPPQSPNSSPPPQGPSRVEQDPLHTPPSHTTPIELSIRRLNHSELVEHVLKLSLAQIPAAFAAIKGEKGAEARFFLALLRKGIPLTTVEFSFCYEDLYLTLKSASLIRLGDFIKLIPLFEEDKRTWHILVCALHTTLAAYQLGANLPLSDDERAALLRLPLTNEAKKKLEKNELSTESSFKNFGAIASDEQFYAFYYWLQTQNNPELKEYYRLNFLHATSNESLKLYTLTEPKSFSDLTDEKRIALIGEEGICSDEERAYILLHNPNKISFYRNNGLFIRTLPALPWINYLILYLDDNFVKFVFKNQKDKPFGNRLTLMKELRRLTYTDPTRAQKHLNMIFERGVDNPGDLFYAFLSGLEETLPEEPSSRDMPTLFDLSFPSHLNDLIAQSALWQRALLPLPHLIFLLRHQMVSQERLTSEWRLLSPQKRSYLDYFLNEQQRDALQSDNTTNTTNS